MTEKAVTNYATILEYLDSETTLEGEEKDKRDALVLAAHLNLAACELRLGNDAKVIEHCNGALELNKDNSKAYFRRAQVIIQTLMLFHYTNKIRYGNIFSYQKIKILLANRFSMNV